MASSVTSAGSSPESSIERTASTISAASPRTRSAFVAGSARRLDDHLDAVEGWLDARFEGGVVVERTLASYEDLVGIA